MKRRTASMLALLAATMALVGCVVLSGQRITIHHDVENDRLSFLVQYDGIFESEEDVPEATVEALSEFASASDIMLIDWFGHLELEKVKAEAAREDAPLASRAFHRTLLDHLTVRALGRYRDPDGRVGVAQEVVIDRVSEVLRLANLALSEHLLVADEFGSPLTFGRLQEAAERDWQWIGLDGHALVVSFPVHPAEWKALRLSALKELAKEWADGQDQEDRKVDDLDPEWFLRLVSSGPISIEQTSSVITVRVGERDRPTTFRCALREGYRPNLEAHLEQLVEGDVDRTLADRLLGEAAEGGTPSAELPSWAPPEDAVRSVLGELLRGGSATRQDAARRWLTEFAERWNQSEGSPAAPLPNTESAAWVEGWREWYREVSGR